MTNLPPNSNGDIGKDASFKTSRRSFPGTPRWLKVLGIIFIVALVLVWIIVNFIINPGGHVPLMP